MQLLLAQFVPVTGPIGKRTRIVRSRRKCMSKQTASISKPQRIRAFFFRATAFTIFILASAHPSRNLTKFIVEPIPFALDTTIPAGHVFLFSNNSSVKSLKLNDLDFSRIKENNFWMAVAGAGSFEDVWVTGVISEKSRKWWDEIHHPEQRIFRSLRRLKVPEFSNASRLRLTDKVKHQVGDQHQLQKEAESKQLRKIFNSVNGNISTSCWRHPTQKSKVVSSFASPRQLPSGKKYHHTGVDLRAWYGTPIKAAGKARVEFASAMIVPGNLVVLDHGGGLKSAYFHLSQFKVEANQTVTAGQVIGQSGSTGRSEAPHLHWEVLWKGRHANPQKFVTAWGRICDPE